MSLLLRRARLVAGAPGPVDVLVDQGVVAAVGPGLHEPTGPRVLDLDGRWLLPGLWDEHVHLGEAALTRQRVNLAPARSAAEAAALVAAAPTPGGDLTVVGAGFRDGLWPDRPSSALLDAAVGERPAVLVSADLHTCWLNAAALRRFGHPHHPTGVLREADAFAVAAAVRAVHARVLDAWVLEETARAAARGVVGVADYEMADPADWVRRSATAVPALRVEVGVYPRHLPAALAAGWRTGTDLGGGGRVTAGRLKVMTDGSLGSRTACCVDPYPTAAGEDGDGQASARGLLTVPTGELVALLRSASGAGLASAVHAIGDEANRLALDAYAAAGRAASRGGRVEHAQLLLEEDLPRFAALGVVASVQPEHAMDDRDAADLHWAGRTHRAFVLRGLLDAGARLVLGSDAPVAPLDPWVTAAAAVTRSRDGREPWHVEQSVTAAEALAASTRDQLPVAAGAVADLAVVEEDPLTCSGERLRRMPVAATLLAGEVTHSIL